MIKFRTDSMSKEHIGRLVQNMCDYIPEGLDVVVTVISDRCTRFNKHGEVIGDTIAIPLADKHTGFRVDIKNLVRTGSENNKLFTLEELSRNLEQVATRFYAGDIKVVDEFLQLYCLDGERPEGGS